MPSKRIAYRLKKIKALEGQKRKHSFNKSGYYGVTTNIGKKKYIAKIMFKGKRVVLGTFYNPKIASAVYELANENLYPNRKNKKPILTESKGYYCRKSKSGKKRYEVRVMKNGKRIYIGSFRTKEEAHKAYTENL